MRSESRSRRAIAGLDIGLGDDHAHPLHRRHRRPARRAARAAGRARPAPPSGIDLVIANAENAAGGSGCLPGRLTASCARPASISSRSATTSTRSRDHRRRPRSKTSASASRPTSRPTPRAASSPSPPHGRRHAGRGVLPARPHVHAAGRLPVPRRRPRAGRSSPARHASSSSTCTPRRRPTSTCWPTISRAASRAVLGTHTHVPTADEQILPGGTAFICDVGMTGPYDSILGRKANRVSSATFSRARRRSTWPTATCGSAARSWTSTLPRAGRRTSSGWRFGMTDCEQ